MPINIDPTIENKSEALKFLESVIERNHLVLLSEVHLALARFCFKNKLNSTHLKLFLNTDKTFNLSHSKPMVAEYFWLVAQIKLNSKNYKDAALAMVVLELLEPNLSIYKFRLNVILQLMVFGEVKCVAYKCEVCCGLIEFFEEINLKNLEKLEEYITQNKSKFSEFSLGIDIDMVRVGYALGLVRRMLRHAANLPIELIQTELKITRQQIKESEFCEIILKNGVECLVPLNFNEDMVTSTRDYLVNTLGANINANEL